MTRVIRRPNQALQATRELLLSSGHPRAAGVTDDVLAVIDGATGATHASVRPRVWVGADCQ